MISTLRIYEDLRETLDERTAQKIAHHLSAVYEDVQQTATKADVLELRTVVRDLAEAQQRTEARLDALTATVAELAEAQKRTEARVGELAEAQKRTEARVAELAEAQKHTEVRMGELAEAQKRTEVRMGELAEAQKRTEVEVGKLAKAMKDTQATVGGLSHTVGYRLEDEAFLALPRLLQRDHGIEVTGRLIRRHLPLKAGGYAEFNIIGEGMREGKRLHVIGEAKTQLHRRDVQRFQARQLAVAQAELDAVFPVLVTHMTPEPGLEDFIRQQGIALYYSYDLVS